MRMMSGEIHRQRGTTLLESLIALVVLAIAVLGLLAVQLRVLAETQTSVRRAQAVRIIEDIGERAKSNPGGFAQLSAFSTGWDEGAGEPAMSNASGDCSNAPCTPGELAARDIRAWKADLKQKLPSGRGLIFVPADESPTNRRQLGVMVGWRANEKDIESAYAKAVSTTASGGADVKCPDGLVCHLAYVQP